MNLGTGDGTVKQLRVDSVSPASNPTPQQLAASIEEHLKNSDARVEAIVQKVHLEALEMPSFSWKVDFTDLGVAVSKKKLDTHQGNPEKLAKFELPDLRSPEDVARLLRVDLPTLRWFAYDALFSKYSLYYSFDIPKRSGGTRTISAPCSKLKSAQRGILNKIVDKMPCEPQAHGFVRGHSTYSNAAPHIGKGTVINVDLKDFFPNIHVERVAWVFFSYGYSPAIATILAHVCTARPVAESVDEHTGQRRYRAVGKRALPQGAPTSPGLANQVAHRLDKRLQGLAQKIGWDYTRYADDITFSGPRLSRRAAQSILNSIVRYIEDCGFTPHPEKRKIVTQGGRQQVTGYNVNEKISVPREYRQHIRSTLHEAKLRGLQERHTVEMEKFNASGDLGKWLLAVRGKIAWVQTAHPELGQQMSDKFYELLQRDDLLEVFRSARRGPQTSH